MLTVITLCVHCLLFDTDLVQVGMFIHSLNGTPLSGKNKAHWREQMNELPPGTAPFVKNGANNRDL